MSHQAKAIKGVKVANHNSSYDVNDHIKDSKMLINELKCKAFRADLQGYSDSKRHMQLAATDEHDGTDSKKFNLLKSTSTTLPANKHQAGNHYSDQKEFNSFRSNTVHSLYSEKKQANSNRNMNGVGILITNNYTQKVKKSISFTKPLVNNQSSDMLECDLVRESTPLYTGQEDAEIKKPAGLLAVVNSSSETTQQAANNLQA